MNVFLLLNTKDDILKNVGNQTVDDSHCVFFVFFTYYGSKYQKKVWLPTFFKISCIQQKKETQTDLEQLEGEETFLGNYPFNGKNADFKGIIQQEMEIVSSFIHPRVIPNM